MTLSGCGSDDDSGSFHRDRQDSDHQGCDHQSLVKTVVVGSPAVDADIKQLKRAVDLHCPVLDDLRAPIPVELSWRRAELPQKKIRQ
jgi:hypothetical protein